MVTEHTQISMTSFSEMWMVVDMDWIYITVIRTTILLNIECDF